MTDYVLITATQTAYAEHKHGVLLVKNLSHRHDDKHLQSVNWKTIIFGYCHLFTMEYLNLEVSTQGNMVSPSISDH